MSGKIGNESNDKGFRSRAWREKKEPRYWWHRLSDTDFVPPVYSDLSESEWALLREWYQATDAGNLIGECCVPLMSLLQALVMGSSINRIVQIGTCSGYSALLVGFMLRRRKARRALFTIDVDPAACEFSGKWLTRAGLEEYVGAVQLHSLDPIAIERAREYLGGDPGLIIIDSSHEYAGTLQELETWYPALAPSGLIVLHDVSHFAADFDVTRQGGVQRAFAEWRKLHPDVEAISLNGDSRTMALDTVYKDACGLGLIYKSAA
jgi:predicted O-methyltransferase YrrM